MKVNKLSVMSTNEFWMYSFFIVIGTLLLGIFALWWFSPSHIPQNFTGFFHITDYLLFLGVTYVVWYQLINEYFSWVIAGFMRKPKHIDPIPGLRVAFLTAYVPGKEPYSMLKSTLEAMVSCDYAHDTWLLDEGNDDIAKEICTRLGVKYFTRKNIPTYNASHGQFAKKTKGGNYNSWFHKHSATYDIVAQLDVDFVPKKSYLLRTLGYFQDPSIAFVVTPQIYGNIHDSWIARGAAEQAYNFYGSMQKGLFGLDNTLLIGANHVMRVAAHNDIEGYSGHIVEDHLTGMRLYAHKWNSVYVPELLAVGEGPSTWQSYFSQQMRWAYGLIDILFRHSPKLLPNMRMHQRINYYLLQQYYFYGVAQVLGISLMVFYFVGRLEITPMKLIPLLCMYVPIIVFQQLFGYWLTKFTIDPEHERGFMIHAKILNWAAWPVYFLAFVGAIAGKKLSYAVTPKGEMQRAHVSLDMFWIHICMVFVTLVCLYAIRFTHQNGTLLVFWAVVNTIIMFCFPTLVALQFSLVSIRTYPKYALMGGVIASIFVVLFAQTSPLSVTEVTPDKSLSISITITPHTEIEPTNNTESPVSVIFHTVHEGESLWKISKHYYGIGSEWKKIRLYSESSIIQPGDVLLIPQE